MPPLSLGCCEDETRRCEQYLARLSQMMVPTNPSPNPGLLVSVPPALIMRILGRRWCQSASSASLATDLQRTQAVKAACLPACLTACGSGGGERQAAPRLTPPAPAPTLLSPSLRLCVS